MIHIFETKDIFNQTPHKLRQYFENDTALIEDTEEVFVFRDGKWVTPQAGISISMHEINKSIAAQMPDADVSEVFNTINEYHNTKQSSYYMLLNKEQSYYTIFIKNNLVSKLSDAVMACMENIGVIKSAQYNTVSDAIEFWVANDGNVTTYYLFDYSNGVVNFGG